MLCNTMARADRYKAGRTHKNPVDVELEPIADPVSEAQLVIRMPQALIDLIEAEAVRMQEERPGSSPPGRSEVVRILIHEGLGARRARRA
jgi:hypothetical protein